MRYSVFVFLFVKMRKLFLTTVPPVHCTTSHLAVALLAQANSRHLRPDPMQKQNVCGHHIAQLYFFLLLNPWRCATLLFLVLFAQRQRMMRRRNLRLASTKLHEILLQLLAIVLQLALILHMVLLQFVELGVQILFVLLQFRLLLLDAQHKHLPHIVLLVLQLGQVIGALRLERLLERHGLVVAVHIGEAHLLETLLAVQFVVARVRHAAHVLHVGANQHFAELHEIAVRFVVHCELRLY